MCIRDSCKYDSIPGKCIIRWPVIKIAAIAQYLSLIHIFTPGTSLYPAFLKNHRLFLKDAQEQTVGYLSFQDDRLYYIVIPLLEQKRAQVKMCISVKQEKPLRGKQNPYKNLDFWIRLPHENPLTFPENISLQIEKLLNDYAKP